MVIGLVFRFIFKQVHVVFNADDSDKLFETAHGILYGLNNNAQLLSNVISFEINKIIGIDDVYTWSR